MNGHIDQLTILMRLILNFISLFSIRIVRVLAISVMFPMAAVAHVAHLPPSLADVIEDVRESVVTISVVREPGSGDFYFRQSPSRHGLIRQFLNDFSDPRNPEIFIPRSLGTGIVVDAAGLIVTNEHVVRDAGVVFVTLHDGTRLKAEMIGHDRWTDLTVLRVSSDRPLKPVEFANPTGYRVGDWVFAVGSPFEGGVTASVGIISSRDINVSDQFQDHFLQTDAAINRANSGGALFDLKGKMVGVNASIYPAANGTAGIGFAVPSHVVKRIVSHLVDFGEIRRGWIGIRTQAVTDPIAESLGMDRVHGVLVTHVEPNGPASKAGIQVGDIVVTLAGVEILESTKDLVSMISDMEPGSEVKIVILREGESVTLDLSIDSLSNSPQGMGTADSGSNAHTSIRQGSSRLFSAELATLDMQLRRQFNISKKVDGVAVLLVDSDSVFVEKDITPGSVIVAVNMESVQTPEELVENLKALKRKGLRSTLFSVSNGMGDIRFVPMPLSSDEE